MAELKGSKTEQNLMTAFAGESQAHTKYLYYASKAKKDGYVQIGALFEETAKNEKEHAKIWFKLLHGGMPATTENLKDAAAGENYEWTDMYAGFAKPRVRKALTILPRCLTALRQLKKSMRNATKSCSKTSRAIWYSRKTATRCGSAPTAATLWLAKKRPRFAPFAHIRRHISKSVRKTIDNTLLNSSKGGKTHGKICLHRLRLCL